jgi:beta-glucanase (GH16 family)
MSREKSSFSFVYWASLYCEVNASGKKWLFINMKDEKGFLMNRWMFLTNLTKNYAVLVSILVIGFAHAQDWQLVWSDEFNAPDIDMSKWSYDVGTGDWGWGNGEAQYYTNNSNNSFIEDGKLIIKAMLQNYGGANYTSARMVTRNHGDWTYGKFVVRAKIPAGTGTWPAIWMLPTDYVYGGWPYSGEIDIMEAVGFDHGTIHANAHCETYNWWNGIPPIGGDLFVNDFHTEFHDYIIEWDEHSIKWYVDNTQYYIYSNNNQGTATWPFNQDFHLILNIAIGGTWGGQQGIDDSIFPVQMEVEYVRVYERNDSEPDPEVTFLVNMQNEQIDEAGVYISGADPQLAGPSGILMSDLGVGNNIWSLTMPVSPGTYTYKFRNGNYDNWDGPGWENSEPLEACGVGEWNDRHFTVSNTDLILGPYCFSSCTACGDNDCTPGDANQDQILNVLDIVMLVAHILLNTENEVISCGDVNNDLEVNVLDIVWIIEIILNG